MANFEITKMQVEKMYAILQLIVHVNYLTLKNERRVKMTLEKTRYLFTYVKYIHYHQSSNFLHSAFSHFELILNYVIRDICKRILTVKFN